MSAARADKSTNVRSAIPWALRAGLAALGAVSPSLAGRAGARLFLTPPRHGAPARERGALSGADPFALRHHGRTLRGWTLGSGPAVLLLHGWGGRSGQLAPLAGALAEAGCAAVAFDAPAHGRSGGSTTSMVGFAEAASAVARRFGARAAVGHSVGGAAIAWAAAHGLELAAAALVAPPQTPVAFMDALADDLRLAPAVRAAVEAGVVRRVGVALEEVDVARCAPAHPPPVLVVHDRDDPDVPLSAGNAVAEAWAADLVVTTGLGHRRILRDRAVIGDVVAFVTSRLPRCGCGRLATEDAPRGVPRCAGCATAEDLWARGRRRAAFRFPFGGSSLPDVTS
jgi:pimeloyl-ACP methyl ester carboxylesterase